MRRSHNSWANNGRSIQAMSSRLDRTWLVLASYESRGTDRCVDVFSRTNGTFGFEEFRRDAEDMGAWTPISYHSGHEYPSRGDAVDAARQVIPWLSQILVAEGAAPLSMESDDE